MNKTRGNYFIVMFMVMIALPYIIWPFISRVVDTTNYEKRQQAQMPELSMKNLAAFPKDFEDYVNDNIPFRNQMIGLNSTIRYYLFHTSTSDRVAVGKNGWLFYTDENDGDPIADYKGQNLLSNEQLNVIASDLCASRDALKVQDIDFVIFIAPNKERIYSNEMPKCYGNPKSEYVAKQIVDYLKENTDLRIVYPIDELTAAKQGLGDEINIYHKTDTHWNELGAYIGTEELLRELEVNIPEYNSHEIKIDKNDDMPGDMAQMLNMTHTMKAGKTFVPEGYNLHDYTCDDSDVDIIRYHAKGADSRKLLIEHDSFGNAMAGIIGSQFDECVLIQHEDVYAAIAKEKPDVFVLETVERYVSSTLSDFEYR